MNVGEDGRDIEAEGNERKWKTSASVLRALTYHALVYWVTGCTRGRLWTSRCNHLCADLAACRFKILAFVTARVVSLIACASKAISSLMCQL
eukprot:6188861-Pleurochrysis_carterae.AAC.1